MLKNSKYFWIILFSIFILIVITSIFSRQDRGEQEVVQAVQEKNMNRAEVLSKTTDQDFLRIKLPKSELKKSNEKSPIFSKPLDFTTDILTEDSFFSIMSLQPSKSKNGFVLSTLNSEYSFEDLALRQGDIVTHIQDTPFVEIMKSPEVYKKEWLSYETAILTVLRNGEEIDIEIEVD